MKSTDCFSGIRTIVHVFAASFPRMMKAGTNPVFLQLTLPLLSCRRYPFEWIVKYVCNESRKKYVRPRLPVSAGGAHPMKIFTPARSHTQHVPT